MAGNKNRTDSFFQLWFPKYIKCIELKSTHMYIYVNNTNINQTLLEAD